MKPNVTVHFDPDIRPVLDMPGGGKVRVCCELMTVIRSCAKGCCAVTWCQAGHPQIAIENGKVVGTSA